MATVVIVMLFLVAWVVIIVNDLRVDESKMYNTGSPSALCFHGLDQSFVQSGFHDDWYEPVRIIGDSVREHDVST